MTKEEFKTIICLICSAETASHKVAWTPDNPFSGHCTLVSLLAQETFGGEILRVDLHHTPRFEHVGWHSWNRFPNGDEVDFTASQFKEPLPTNLSVEVRTRENLFSYRTIQSRYELLKQKFDEELSKLRATVTV